jgi:hypothetical protein
MMMMMAKRQEGAWLGRANNDSQRLTYSPIK